MKHLDNVPTLDDATTYSIEFDEIDECPICHNGIGPLMIHAFIHNLEIDEFDYKHALFEIFYKCPKCKQTFLTSYCASDSTEFDVEYDSELYAYKLYSIAPTCPRQESFNDFINSTSPDFVKIYNQALTAESLALDQISGIAFRKALEFLIKDFLILQNPEKIEEIKNAALGNCINNFIDNAQLKQVATRAVWLGNDHAHYQQIYTDKDINDLKRLIRLTTHWISLVLETAEVEKIEKITSSQKK